MSWFQSRIRAFALLLAVTCLATAPPGRAAADEAAAAIAEHLLDYIRFDANLDELADETIDSLSINLARFGAKITDKAAFRTALLGTYEVDFRHDLKSVYATGLRDILSNQERAALLRFFSTPDGQTALAVAFPNAPASPALQPLVERWDTLNSHTASVRHAYSEETAEMFSSARFADLIENPALVAFQNEDMRKRVTTALRGSGP